ncbi:HAMP domain-containing histidine kinase [Candidatus Kaiserbacteria bacterium]|nr:HAMP domain-containing histidine kinase [Candidatus Kaiserbacteria bacterium]
MNEIDPIYCSWDTSSKLMIFSDNVFGGFIYYSHLLPVICVLSFIILLLWQNRRDPIINSLVIVSISFTLWSLSDLVLWATANPDHTMFFWSIIIHFELLIYIASLYFIHYYVSHRPPKIYVELILLAAYVPVAIFAHTSLNLVAFDYTNCWREAIEGPLLAYVYLFEICIAVYILTYGIYHVLKRPVSLNKREMLLATAGTFLFLISFSLGNILGTLEVDWELGQYGLFAIPFFIGLLSYLIIKYKGVEVKLFSTEVLVVAILILVASILFIRKIENVRIVTFITIFLITNLGIFLVRSVRREIKQREQIEKLAKNLARANKRLKEIDKLKSEFVSIASHQLRSPLTTIRGFTSMLLEGSFGKLNPKVQTAVEHIADSSKFMASSVEDYLNVSRIESGNMKYESTDFNLKTETEQVVEDFRQQATKKGILLMFKSDLNKKGIVHADVGKVRQILHNLINNAIKYTPRGSVTLLLHDSPKLKKVYLDVIDTGIGISDEALEHLFAKFERAANAHHINVVGTGLGLYVARKMAQDMGGNITAKSDGENCGSVFTLELPLEM